MNKEEYLNRKSWKLPEGFPNDPKTLEEKHDLFYGVKGAENGWWWYARVDCKCVPPQFKKTLDRNRYLHINRKRRYGRKKKADNERRTS